MQFFAPDYLAKSRFTDGYGQKVHMSSDSNHGNEAGVYNVPVGSTSAFDYLPISEKQVVGVASIAWLRLGLDISGSPESLGSVSGTHGSTPPSPRDRGSSSRGNDRCCRRRVLYWRFGEKKKKKSVPQTDMQSASFVLLA